MLLAHSSAACLTGVSSSADHLTNCAARMRETTALQQLSVSSTPWQPSSLSSSSPFRCTFYGPAAAVGSRAEPELAVKRDPLNPSYTLPAYDVRCPSPPPFLRSSLDVSDIDGTKPRRPVQQLSHTMTDSRQQQSATAPRLSPPPPSRCPVCCAPCSPPCASWLSPSSPPSLPHQPQPHRFQHSPTVLSVPSLPFSALYSAAVGLPSTAFCFAINRPFHLPSHQSPIGGETQPKPQKQRPQPQPQLKPRARVRLRDVESRVDCWRESAGEVSRDARAWRGAEWRRMTADDRQLVQSLA